jgi:hypothetical protein
MINDTIKKDLNNSIRENRAADKNKIRFNSELFVSMAVFF